MNRRVIRDRGFLFFNQPILTFCDSSQFVIKEDKRMTYYYIVENFQTSMSINLALESSKEKNIKNSWQILCYIMYAL